MCGAVIAATTYVIFSIYARKCNLYTRRVRVSPRPSRGDSGAGAHCGAAFFSYSIHCRCYYLFQWERIIRIKRKIIIGNRHGVMTCIIYIYIRRTGRIIRIKTPFPASAHARTARIVMLYSSTMHTHAHAHFASRPYIETVFLGKIIILHYYIRVRVCVCVHTALYDMCILVCMCVMRTLLSLYIYKPNAAHASRPPTGSIRFIIFLYSSARRAESPSRTYMLYVYISKRVKTTSLFVHVGFTFLEDYNIMMLHNSSYRTNVL